MKPIHRPHRLARALVQLRASVNRWWPNRSRKADGWIGDAAHAARGDASDHNPWVDDPEDASKGVVTGLDITSDPANGCDVDQLAAAIIAHELKNAKKRKPRVKYMIRNRRIISSYPAHGFAAWTWRPYKGKNPHDRHLHISVHPDPEQFDSVEEWPAPFCSSCGAPLSDPEEWGGECVDCAFRLLRAGHLGEAGAVSPLPPSLDASPERGHQGRRSAEAGEVCTCGRQAVVVLTGGPDGDTGWCGRHDGGHQRGPCPFCGEPKTSHPGRCPRYRLRPERGGDA